MKMEHVGPELLKALVSAKQNFGEIKKNCINPHLKNKYADLSSILEAINHALLLNNLFLSQESTLSENRIKVITLIFHTSGQWIESEGITVYPKDLTPQSIGSAITYAKRYDLCAILGISADVDDDGNEGNEGSKTTETKQTYKPVSKPQAQTRVEIPKPKQEVQINNQPEVKPLEPTPYKQLVEIVGNNGIDAAGLKEITGYSTLHGLNAAQVSEALEAMRAWEIKNSPPDNIE